MKKFLFSVFLLISNVNFAQNTYVPDDSFEQELINLGYDSGPLDDFVPTANINTVKELNISIPEINSLVGIQDFIALEKLTLFLDDVINIDLTNNTKLKELIIDDDLLESLDLTNSSDLELFHMTNTSVQSIDLSKNLKLNDVTIGNTSIIDLDLSLNTQLEKVNVGHGIIQNINLKNGNNTSITDFYALDQLDLQCIRVDNTNYSVTNWTQIDNNTVYSETCGNFSEPLTYVPDDNFEQELINLGYDSGSLDDYVPTNNINTITELNLNFKNISDLTGIQDFIALENLQFTQNQVTEVNLTTLSNLKTLYSNNNSLSELDITQNTKLINLFIGGNSISQIDLSNNSLLEQLSVANNNLSEINIDNLTKLNWLGVNNNNISTINLNNNIKITYLYCNNNNLNGSLDLSDKDLLFDISCGNNPLTEIKLPPNNKLDGVHVNSTLISELDLRNQSNLISNATSFLEIQDNPNLTCVFVDDVDRFNNDVWGAITKDSQTTFVTNEAACAALSCSITVDELSNQELCDVYTLPNLTNGNYFTLTGGNGTQLNSGDIITSSQTIFIYNEDPSDPTCFKESSFEVIIHQTPMVDSLLDVSTESQYQLPTLTNGNYYTENDGQGTQLNAGDIITTTQTIFIFNQNGNCSNESSFKVTIIPPINESETIIPSFFTPNNDGVNDRWIVSSNNNIKAIYIFDRFGKLIAKPSLENGWNGKYLYGKKMISNTYWYKIVFENNDILTGKFAMIY